MELIKIEKFDGELRVDSRLIAKELGNDHKPTVAMIRKYESNLEKYGKVLFKNSPSLNPDSCQHENVFYLNEKQSTFLVTLSRNSDQAVELKQKLVDSYYHYKEKDKPKLPESYKDALIALVYEIEEKEKAQLELKEAKPKIEFHDELIESDGLYSMGQTAKLLGTGRTRLFVKLREMKIFFNTEPYQSFKERGYFEIKTTTKNSHVQTQAFTTPKGLEWLNKKLKADGDFQTSF